MFFWWSAGALSSGGFKKKPSAGGRRDEPPLSEKQDLVAQPPRLAEVVRRHDNFRSRRIEGLDHRFDLACRARVEAGGGLVEEQHLRVQRPGPRERQALLLAAGKHASRPAREVPKAHPSQPLPHQRRALRLP